MSRNRTVLAAGRLPSPVLPDCILRPTANRPTYHQPAQLYPLSRGRILLSTEKGETHMAVHVTRDWRGLKYKVSECSSDELVNLLVNAQHTQREIGRFIQQIDSELVARSGNGQHRDNGRAG